MKPGNPDHPATIARSLLTAKEYEAWEAIVIRGWSQHRLARVLGISASAVRDRRTSAHRKLTEYARIQLDVKTPKPKPQSNNAALVVNLLVQRDGPTCYLCRRDFPPNQLNVEHIIPTARGGTDEAENIALACSTCNNKKGAKYVSLHLTSERAVYHPR